MISEIRSATVGVADLERSRDFYAEAFGYVVLGEAAIGGAETEALWRMPAGLTGRAVVMGPENADSGLLRLVGFDGPGERIRDGRARMWDHGHFALNVRVGAIEPALDRIRRAGGQVKAPPTEWTVTPDLSAWDSQFYDPDGVVVDVFELRTSADSALADHDGRPSALQTVASRVGDARASARFYATLGFEPLYDTLIEGMEEFFGLPPGTALHNINMFAPGAPDVGRVEIAQYVGLTGRRSGPRAVPPNLGILSVSLETDDLAAATALLVEGGAETVCEPVEPELPLYGRVSARSFLGPDGEVLELYRLHRDGRTLTRDTSDD